jgi:two-component system response regulator MprA
MLERRIRVLVADDSETILLLLRTRLEMEGFDVITVANGKEALEAIEGLGEDARPDVILLDAMMPVMSGLDALQTLRAAGSDIPVLIVSAHQERDATGSLNLDVSGFIRKPIDFDELIRRIKALAEHRDANPNY